MKTRYKDDMPPDFKLNLYSFDGEDQAAFREQFKYYLTMQCGLRHDGRCVMRTEALSDHASAISLEDLIELRIYVMQQFENEIDKLRYPGLSLAEIMLAKAELNNAERQREAQRTTEGDE